MDSSELTPEMDMLDSILTGNRFWIVDTLVSNDYSTSPTEYAVKSPMDDVLTRYENADSTIYGALYKGLVDGVCYYDNADSYVANFFDSATETWADIICASDTFGSDNFESTVSELTASKAELQYESILKKALTENYTSSLGITYCNALFSFESFSHYDRQIGYCWL